MKLMVGNPFFKPDTLSGTVCTSMFLTTLGGDDASSFSITSGGVLTFNTSPDYEMPGSAATSNVYTVLVTALDGADNTLTRTQTLTITVTDVNEHAPTFTSAATVDVPENETAVITVMATDADDDVVMYTLSGADAGLFTFDASSGVLTFTTAPNYEMPKSSAMSNTYTVLVTASDSGGLSDTQTLTITVTNVEEATPLSVEASAGIVVYPNPSRGVIYVSSGEGVTGYTLVGGSGHVLKKGTLQAGKEDHTMTIADLPAGVYFLRVQTDKGGFTQKVIKH